MVEVPESEWQHIQELSERIKKRSWDQEEDISNLNNLLHALHGEGIRDRKYTLGGKPSVFVNGSWVSR
jgi:hypothetical protein